MKVSLHISGLILVVAGILFLVSAVLSRHIYLFAAGGVCAVCGVLLMLPRHHRGGGKYSS